MMDQSRSQRLLTTSVLSNLQHEFDVVLGMSDDSDAEVKESVPAPAPKRKLATALQKRAAKLKRKQKRRAGSKGEA